MTEIKTEPVGNCEYCGQTHGAGLIRLAGPPDVPPMFTATLALGGVWAVHLGGAGFAVTHVPSGRRAMVWHTVLAALAALEILCEELPDWRSDATLDGPEMAPDPVARAVMQRVRGELSDAEAIEEADVF